MNLASRVSSKNLRIALIDAAHQNWALNLYGLEKEYESYRSQHGGRSLEELEDETEYVPEMEAFILSLPLAEEKVLEIKSLTLDGDRQFYSWIDPYFYHGGNVLKIQDLSGIEVCRNLAALHLGQGIVEQASIAPLKKLPFLKELSFCMTQKLTNYENLLLIPSLERVKISNFEWASAEEKALISPILAELRNKGVSVLDWATDTELEFG